MKKKIYMVQPNIMYDRGVYLPYTAATVAAYSLADSEISQCFELGGILFLREDTDTVVREMDSPSIVGFSCYVWNLEYNKVLAKKIKALHPECTIIFGGHNVKNDASLLDECDFIDFLIHGEGEQAFCSIIKQLGSSRSFCDIPNISYRVDGSRTVSTQRREITDIDFPSPYSMGLLDAIVAENPSLEFSAILETNRGCPYGCAFCDWSSNEKKVRQFPAQRVFADIEWMVKNKIEFCYCSDANFGMLARDAEIADKIIECRREYGYPKKFRVNYAKHNNKTVFDINLKLNRYGISKGVTLSFQTMSELALKKIGRSNMDMALFSELMSEYTRAGIATYSELILGLPGETYESFCAGVGKLLESGQHESLMIYNCELLCNTLLADDSFIRQNGIEYALTPLYLRHDEPRAEEIREFSRAVIATADMDSARWIDANMFSIIVQSCHGMGLLRCFAVYLHFERQLPYEEFYSGVARWWQSHPETVTGKIYAKIRDEFLRITQGNGVWSLNDIRFGNVSWPYEEALYLGFVYALDEFYGEIAEYLQQLFDDTDILDELMSYQRALIKLPGKTCASAAICHDFPSYFDAIFCGEYRRLEQRKFTASARDDNVPDTWQEFARQMIWYGRKEQRNIFKLT